MQTNDTGSRLTHDVCDFVQAQLGAKGSTLTWLDDAGEIAGFERGGDGRQFEQSDTVPAEMKRGSVLLYSAKIYHGSGANRWDKVRKALNVN